ncbi:lipid-A-disaccharide synthase [candidate division WOR-1 bacterium RIFOXYB2_FULL_48_7]|uniref:Lipid-A-disaccharide synthase n=1 Tax=candidate division WOR-1 bacterium RIFOXYB2_FULL_48_7 TaxID=1802583 RepID=A0A1F4TVL7_UNCSA|nr:MAG: lipid-A-disaccharide synthase [candidate division WOR-1 bacterium RIFOXYB2_FULL_48_7]
MKIFVSAGEVSGDVHGAYLINELKRQKPGLQFFGVGSDNLAAAGARIDFDISRRGTIGIIEALPNILPIFSVYQQLKKLLLKEKPDLAILIDSQGFNVPLARFCRRHKIKTVYYIAPQEWLWGTVQKVKALANLIDKIIAIFPPEYSAYKSAGANVSYFGHPLIDIVTSRATAIPGRIALCPGSRTQELKVMLPILLQAAMIIQKRSPNCEFVIPAANSRILAAINSYINQSSIKPKRLIISDKNRYDLLVSSELAICTSGTINLEASLLGVPNIMAYKLSWLTYFIGKYLLHIDRKIKYFSMPNILLGRLVVPELVMDEATPEKIARQADGILADAALKKTMLSSFAELRTLLGSPGVISKAATEILR